MEQKDELRNMKDMNETLVRDIKSMATVSERLNSELQEVKEDLEEANRRACRAEDQFAAQHAVEMALRRKVEALEAVVMSGPSNGNGLPSPHRSQSAQVEDHESPIPADDWREDATLIRRGIESIHASCTMAQPESQMDRESRQGLRFVEQQFLGRDLPGPSGGSPVRSRNLGKSPKVLTPQQQRRLADEDLVARRRSTMLFEGLIQPSLGAESRESLAAPLQESPSGQGTCLRCKQLEDTLQTVVIDNDYYREANTKLQDNVRDVVSRHNALVRLFERERQRRREARAEKLAEESRVAARDRAIIEAQQRAEIEDSDGLVGEFSRGLHISSPKRVRAMGDTRLRSSPIVSPAPQ
ncbi:hypothetical protein EC988_005588 [Linderina pennispora]|nr:hypothetical protein EC988_005588 [Linderina pennispora]